MPDVFKDGGGYAVTTGRESGGCWLCGVNTPVVYLAIRHGFAAYTNAAWSRPYALCLPCLGRWFPGWGSDRVQGWLDRQQEAATAWERDAEVRKEADDRHLAAWLAGVVK